MGANGAQIGSGEGFFESDDTDEKVSSSQKELWYA